MNDLLGQLPEFTPVIFVRNHDLEFVTSEPADPGAVTSDILQPFGDFDQQGIAGLMAERVIDPFEFVEVHHHQRAGTVRSFERSQCPLELAVHLVAVGQSGERIEIGHFGID